VASRLLLNECPVAFEERFEAAGRPSLRVEHQLLVAGVGCRVERRSGVVNRGPRFCNVAGRKKVPEV
jgi:hypothetical protein